MKTAKLKKIGRGWQLLGEKTLPVPGNFGLTDDMDGQEVEFDNTGGPVKLIRFNNNDYTKLQNWQPEMAKQQGNYGYKGQSPNRNYSQQQERRDSRRDGESRNDPARAPYNFVPLNEIAVPSENKVSFDAFHEERLSGHISMNIKTLTPIFIRGNKENLLNPKGQLILQGSSIRGLVRTLVEICSCAKFKADCQYEDRRMYFRAMADMAIRLREEYKNEISNGVEAGYLRYNKQMNTYSIHPAEGFDRVQAKGKFKYHRSNSGIEIHSGSMQGKFQNWVVFPPDDQEQPIPIDPKLIKAYEEDENRAEQVFDILKYARKGKSESIELPNGVPVFFKRDGNTITSFGHTRNYRLPYSHTISSHIPEKLKEDGFLDIAESIFGKSGETTDQIISGKVFFEDSIPRKMSEVKTRIAALKILGNPKPTTFQHYLVQPNGTMTPKEKLQHWGDMNAKIRGYKQYWHRANPEEDNSALWKERRIELKKNDIQKWINQNPTAKPRWNESMFLLRVETDRNGTEKVHVEGDINNLPAGLKSVLVEYHNIDNAVTKQLGIAKPQNSIVNLVLEQEQFESKIRFENLTKVELGALLFVLDLPENCAHKLGMGKSLGLGSIKISPTLSIINRKVRYNEVFNAQNSWVTGEEQINSLTLYKDHFAQYMSKHLSKGELINNAVSYWEKDERMQALKHILNLENSRKGNLKWQQRTRYMDLKEFKSRRILPAPSEVINPDMYKND